MKCRMIGIQNLWKKETSSKKYHSKNKENRNEYLKNRRETDINFKLVSNTMCETRHAF